MIHGRKHPMEHMVAAIVFPAALNGQHVPGSATTQMVLSSRLGEAHTGKGLRR